MEQSVVQSPRCIIERNRAWRYRKRKCASIALCASPLPLQQRVTLGLLLLVFSMSPGSSQQSLSGGLFPGIVDLSSFKPIRASSTCRLNNNPLTYCISSLTNSSLQSCTQRTCLQNCCKECGSSLPVYVSIDQTGTIVDRVYIASELRPGSSLFANSFNFFDGYFAKSNMVPAFNFSLAVWIKQDFNNEGCLLHKDLAFTFVVQRFSVTLLYYTVDDPTVQQSATLINVLSLEQSQWHHVALLIYGLEFTLFVDGNVERTYMLSGTIKDNLGTIIVGKAKDNTFKYRGLMQDIKYYSSGLSNRDIIEAMNGTLINVPYTHCRCPPSNPRISPVNPFYCMKNGVTLVNQLVPRLSDDAHPPEYLVDGEVITYWISEKVEDVTIEVDLLYSKLQIYLVSIVFYSPPSQGIRIDRSLDYGKSYQAWQYFATNCLTSFGMVNDGPLPEPDSVNCLQIPNPKASWETITFQPAEAGPDNKPQRPFGVPGCIDFHCSPKLIDFGKATNVRFRLTGNTLVTHPDHRYFGIRRIIVGGTCDCYGHGSKCVFNESALVPYYSCECDPRTFTQGLQCEQCLPLYNDKPFKRGTVLDAYPCRRCQCYDHADSCVYSPAFDKNPADRSAPGGGVCVGCKHNTIGLSCEACKPMFYRPSGRPLNAVDVCQPCECFGPGVVVGEVDCQKDDSSSSVLAGQCKCKTYATGRQCTECVSGYFQLAAANPDGCTRCNCNTDGTKSGSMACHISSGQCDCKTNVIGVKCSSCRDSHYGLSSLNPLGCSPCNCNPLGTPVPLNCSQSTGQCICRDRFEGRACDRCKAGFYGPTCSNCTCNSIGTEPGLETLCNKDTGQCTCKFYVTGLACDRCKIGYYGLDSTSILGCTPCNCDGKGTKGNTGECHESSGACACKALVTGRQCNLCKAGTYDLSASNPDGCSRCNCNARGTVGGDRTPQDQLGCTVTGQCSCLSNVQGLQCDRCIPDYFWNPFGLGCLPCNCHPLSSLSTICNGTGHCICRSDGGVGGAKCDQCLPGYFAFSSGRCAACGCSIAGSLRPECDSLGLCMHCKRNVEGNKCDTCKAGTANLQLENPFGCSGAPSEQGPPSVTAVNSRTFAITWLPPDQPNGIITKYELFRNASLIYAGLERTYTDSGLIPFTYYAYYVLVYTAAGFATSVDSQKLYQTPEDSPDGLDAPFVTEIKDRSVVSSWFAPAFPNGKILYYKLVSVNKKDLSSKTHYTGLLYTYLATGLNPFTVYDFSVVACTSAGCVTSDVTTISTRSAAPDSQPAPYVTPVPGGMSMYVSWDPPSQPNGDIQFYDVFMRTSPFSGEGNTVAVNLNPRYRNYTAQGLVPYTLYEFRVVSYTAQVKGSTASNWTAARTLEAVPNGAEFISPRALTLNSSTVAVFWSAPGSPNGVILRYEVYRYEKPSNFLIPILSASTLGDVKETALKGLQPYSQYQVSVKACNQVGCTAHSSKSSCLTSASAPVGQPPPLVDALEGNAVLLRWRHPSVLNGPDSTVSFVIERTNPVFYRPAMTVSVGVRFSGFGYYQLDRSLIADSATTQIEFSFRTRYPDGMLFFAASDGQEDFLAVEFRDGCPWFVFDTESGPASFTISKNTSFHDNNWHSVVLTRNMRDGDIVIDGVHRGSGSGTGSANVIGQISSVFVGGLPPSYAIYRRDSGNRTMKRSPFIGCIRDFKYKGVVVDFSKAVNKSSVAPLSDHCPSSLTSGLYFKGGGFMTIKAGVFKGGTTFSIKFRLRTTVESGLLLFAYDATRVLFLMFLRNKAMYLSYSTPTDSGTYVLSVQPVCDGLWHDVELVNYGRQVSIGIDNSNQAVTTLPLDFLITSQVFIGGVPSNSPAEQALLQFGESLHQPFGGCILVIVIASPVDIQSSVESFLNVEFDGCPPVAGGSSAVTGCSDIPIVEAYKGRLLTFTDIGLAAYTEYMYRVKSYQDGIAGYALSDWVAIRSSEGAPNNFMQPVIVALFARSVTLTWAPPQMSGGLVQRYQLNAYAKEVGRRNSSSLVLDASVYQGSIASLDPYTLYLFTVTAYTLLGSIESDGVYGKTLESIPEDFEPPMVVAYPTALNISWAPPGKPNGEILFYQVDVNDERKFFATTGFSFYADNLKVYTLYKIQVTVCGKVNCTWNVVLVYTGQLAPTGVVAPNVRVLGSSRLEVTWQPPLVLNGVIQLYEVLVGLDSSTTGLRSAFNATPGTYQTVLSDLAAGTVYYVRVKAFTMGGGALSPAAQAKTEESAPEDIPPPKATVVGSRVLGIAIVAPLKPNGIVVRYVLYHNGVSVLDGLSMNYVNSQLLPYTRHTFQTQACTAKGCGFSDELIVYTLDGPPVGSISLNASVVSSRLLRAMWSSIQTPNGLITYTVSVKGEFYINPGLSYDVVNMSYTCYRGNVSNQHILCDRVLPFAAYEIRVNGSNLAGYIISNSVFLSTPPDVPDGVRSPSFTNVTSTRVSLQWGPPGRANGVVLFYALLALYPLSLAGSPSLVLIKKDLFFNHILSDLKPFTQYSFRVEVGNQVGSSISEWSNVTTLEDVPSGLDTPKIAYVGSRSVVVEISPPVFPNGIISKYIVYINKTTANTTLETSVTVAGLQPFTLYSVHVAACTSVGCLNSSATDTFRTLQDVPDGQPPPVLSAVGPRSVLVTWQQPAAMNGVILSYVIQRRSTGTEIPSAVATVMAVPSGNRYVDGSVKPFSYYDYRIIAQTSVGGTPGPYSTIRTPEGDPEGLSAPTVEVLTPNSVQVRWTAPTVPNGAVTHYYVTVPGREDFIGGVLTFQYVMTGLLSYVEYPVAVRACTIGGCGDSPPTRVRTYPSPPSGQRPPSADALSNSTLRVRWSEPSLPNGPIRGYVLMRRTLEDLISRNSSVPSSWLVVFTGLATVFDDGNLGVYSLQQYMVTCVTSEGNATSNASVGFRTGPGFPLAGPILSVRSLNHTAVYLQWQPPPLLQLRGEAKSYEVTYEIAGGSGLYAYGMFQNDVTSVTVGSLRPSTTYLFRVSVNNGAGSANSEPAIAKTLAGIPEGFDKPVIYSIGAFDIRVYWQPPKVPNGDIDNYTIVVNDVKRDTVPGSQAFHQQANLKPYTDYIVKVQVCTQYSCILSEGVLVKTLPAAPSGLAPPSVYPLSSNSMLVQWDPPLQPNGALIGYQVFRRSVQACPGPLPPARKCTYITCSIKEQLCGTVCYDPAKQVCCAGKLYSIDPTKTCCATNYLPKALPSHVCCGGQFYQHEPTYRCCYGYYVQVLEGQICCKAGGSVVVAVGSGCCGEVPYDANGSQVCLCGGLYDRFPAIRKCCGGRIISIAEQCCGDEAVGLSYPYDPTQKCCGTSYVPASTSLCCVSSVGDYQAYSYNSTTLMLQDKCCGKTRIATTLDCCTETGYDNSSAVCADRSLGGTFGCGSGRVCSLSQRATSFCDRCDFDFASLICASVDGFYDPSWNKTDVGTCASPFLEVLGNSLDPAILRFTDTNLVAYTRYEYYVVALNTEGNVSSLTNASVTLSSGPEGLSPPIPTVISQSKIAVTWSSPAKPNGEVTEYLLYRITWDVKVEVLIFRGLAFSFTDSSGLQPNTGYMYVLGACTSRCTNVSATAVVYTQESVPESVNPPVLISLSPYSVLINWTLPSKPNGNIIRYNVSMIIQGKYVSVLPEGNLGERMSALVDNLKPYTVYTFRVTACTVVGCASGPDASVRTLEGAPDFVGAPRLIVLSARRVYAEWNEPVAANGVVRYYLLHRNFTVVYNGSSSSFVDQSVLPATTYAYSLSAITGGGSTRSVPVSVLTPESSPENIAAPTLVPASSSTVTVSWIMPALPNGVVTSYSVVYQEVSRDIFKVPAGMNMTKVISGLRPYTVYHVRIEACTVKGCGVGDKAEVRTLQAAPDGQGAPYLQAMSSTIVEIMWGPPSLLNGVITSYQVERRQAQSDIPLIIFIGSELEYIDTRLIPYTDYQYRVRAVNIIGSTLSSWSTIRTLEGKPEGVPAPTIDLLSSTRIRASWTPPSIANGVIVGYDLRARLFSQIGDEYVIKCCIRADVYTVEVEGLLPSTRYEFQLSANTSVGPGFGPWTIVTTTESIPSGLPVLKADTNPDGSNDGRSLRIFWDPPLQPNGVIATYVLYDDIYVVYQGLEQSALVRRLSPFTNYTFRLAVCNSVGCATGPKQVLTTAEVLPGGQQPPSFASVGPAHVLLNWKPPSNPNGRILFYNVYRRTDTTSRRRRRAVEDLLYSTNDTSPLSYMYNDTSVLPATSYSYKITVANSRGSLDSDWVTVSTPSAPPDGVGAPLLSTFVGPTILVRWRAPSRPNGAILYYEVYRNESRVDSTSALEYTDRSTLLQPNTVYTYYVVACGAAGCTRSPSTSVVTLQAAPESMLPPTLQTVDKYSIRATWLAPGKPNGDIQKYQLFVAPNLVPVFEGYAFQFVVSGLVPFSEYRMTVSACTVSGCAVSKPAVAFTAEDVPEVLDPPLLFVLGSNAIEARWFPPQKPNGIIQYYLLNRDGSVVYNGSELIFIDRSVKGGTTYGYSVAAANNAGSVRSAVAYSKATSPSAPENVSTPILTARSASTVLAEWSPPGLPNGVIIGYFIAYGQQRFDVGLALKYTAVGLKPFTAYDFRVEACTLGGCSSSLPASVRTLEAAPSDQTAPYFDSQYIKSDSVRVQWYPPQAPNGVIIRYELYRRFSSVVESIVYSGPSTSFTDSGETIVPNSRYEYRVLAVNSAGNASSPWSAVTTTNAPPEGVYPAVIRESDIFAHNFTFYVQEPAKPYGQILSYTLEVLGLRNISVFGGTSGVVTGLTSYTLYTVRLIVCNSAGCASGPASEVTTKPNPPEGFIQSPTVRFKNTREMHLTWVPPLYPNGPIIRYEVSAVVTCPQSSKPGSLCTPETRLYNAATQLVQNVSGLAPYTSYKLMVTAYNPSGAVSSPLVEDITFAENPVVLGPPSVKVSGNSIEVDWTASFDLRSRLDDFAVIENNVLVYSGDKLRLVRDTLAVGYYKYIVNAMTSVNGLQVTVSTPEVTVSVGKVDPTAAAETAEAPWYRTVWFLALIALVVILILFVLFIRCCRNFNSGRTVYARQREPLPIKRRMGSRATSQMDVRSELSFSQLPYVQTLPRRKTPEHFGVVPASVIPSEYSSTRDLLHDDLGNRETNVDHVMFSDDDPAWDGYIREVSGRDSGLYNDSPMSLEDDADGLPVQNGYYTIQKQRILFPDTHL